MSKIVTELALSETISQNVDQSNNFGYKGDLPVIMPLSHESQDIPD